MLKSHSSRFFLLALLAAVLSVQAPISLDAGNGRWTRFGPGQRYILAFALDPAVSGTLYMSQLYGGVFRSLDGGLSWISSSEGLGSLPVRALAANGSSVYAFDLFGRLYRSDNHGGRWIQIYNGEVFQGLPFSVYDVFEDAEILFGSGESPAIYLKIRFGVYRSTDQGQTWERVLEGGPEIAALAVDPTAPGTLYASFVGDDEGPTLVKSTDGGDTWVPLGPAPVGAFPGHVKELTVLPTNPATVLAAAFRGGVFRSVNGGASWEKVTLDPAGDWIVDELVPDPRSASTVYAFAHRTFWQSTDGGRTWQASRPTPFEPPQTILIDPATGIFYGADERLVARSGNGGRRWRTVYLTGLGTLQFGTLDFHPEDPSTVYVSWEQIFRSTDAGRSWTDLTATSRNPQPVPATDLAWDPEDPSIVYAATQRGILRSSDGGETWTLLTQLPSQDSSIIPATLTLLDSRTILASGCGIHRSTDAGRTWTTVFECLKPGATDESGRQVREFWVDPNNPRTVYAEVVVLEGRHTILADYFLYKSVDGGLTWRPILGDGQSMVIDAKDPGTIYALRRQTGAFVKSTDGGRTWRRISLFFPNPIDLRMDLETPTTFYAAAAGKGVYRSSDGGRTWTPINQGLDIPSLRIFRLAIHPTLPHRLYVMTDQGIFGARF